MIRRISERFAALSDPTRLKIIMRLKSGECNVSTLCAELGVAQSSVSKHLAVLRSADFVDVERGGSQAIYRICDPTIFKICEIVCGSVTRRFLDDGHALGLDAEHMSISTNEIESVRPPRPAVRR